MDHNKEFETLIKRDQALHLSKSWRGNLLGYLEKVKEDPTTAKLSHARLYDRMMKAGVRDIHESGDLTSSGFQKTNPSKYTISLPTNSSASKKPSPRSFAIFMRRRSKAKKAGRFHT